MITPTALIDFACHHLITRTVRPPPPPIGNTQTDLVNESHSPNELNSLKTKLCLIIIFKFIGSEKWQKNSPHTK
jgi:hypothetical protein